MASAVKSRHDKPFNRDVGQEALKFSAIWRASAAVLMMKTTAQWVFDKNKIKRADNLLKGCSRTVNA